MVELDPLQTAIHKLATRFSRRQVYVRDALADLRPDRLAFHDREVSGDALVGIMKDYLHVPASGTWGAWKYMLHGSGCLLVHLTTGEPIEWDPPDLLTFDRFWLANWSAWYLEQPDSEDVYLTLMEELEGKTATINDLVFPTLNQLTKMGVLYQRDSAIAFNKYTLVEG
jgi:hypothetical protein